MHEDAERAAPEHECVSIPRWPSGDEPSPPSLVVWIPWWNLGPGTELVAARAPVIDEICPCVHRIGPQGGIVSLAPDEDVGAVGAALAALRATGRALVPSITTRTNGHRSTAALVPVLHDPARTARHVWAITDLVRSRGYAGITVDYGEIGSEDRKAVVAFVTQLADSLHAEGTRLAVVLSPDAGPEPGGDAARTRVFAALGEVVDEVWLPTYDYHSPETPPGPIAPIDWIREVLGTATRYVPPDKIVWGVSASGYDWAEEAGTAISHEQAVDLADHVAGGRVRWDPMSESPWFDYAEPDGTAHEVWFEDARSVAAKRRAAAAVGVRAMVLWLSATPDPQLWTDLARPRRRGDSE